MNDNNRFALEKEKIALLLEAKKIRPGDFFCCAQALYQLTKGLLIKGLDGRPADLTENRLWEQWDSVKRVEKKDFEAQQALFRRRERAKKGIPDGAALQRLALKLVASYEQGQPLEPLWKRWNGFGEEALRLIAKEAARCLAARHQWPAQKQKELAAAFFHDAVWCKVGALLEES